MLGEGLAFGVFCELRMYIKIAYMPQITELDFCLLLTLPPYGHVIKLKTGLNLSSGVEALVPAVKTQPGALFQDLF